MIAVRRDKRISAAGERLRQVFSLEPTAMLPREFTALLRKLDD